MTDHSGKSVAITGASRGIGAAAARHLAGLGARVTLAARSEAEISALAQEITAAGGTASAIACDVSVYADVEAMVAHALERHGGLDVLVNNAGVIEPIAHLAQSDPADWSRVVDINLKGVYHGLRAALPAMRERGGGTVINLSSGAATASLEGWSHYCATKAAVLSLTRCADKECRGHGIRVLGLSPGTVATDMQTAIRASGVNPVSQLDWSAHIPAEWVARAIAWLMTPAADEFLGEDFSLKTPEGRARVGLAPA